MKLKSLAEAYRKRQFYCIY